MSENNPQLCPNCKRGKMQPAGKTSFLGETEDGSLTRVSHRINYRYEADVYSYITMQ
jgi:hypothetical protein